MAAEYCLLLTVCLTGGGLRRAPVWSVPGMSRPVAGQEFSPFPLHTPLPCTGPTSPFPKPPVPRALPEGRACLWRAPRGEREDKVKRKSLGHSSSPDIQVDGEGSEPCPQGYIRGSHSHGCIWFPHEIQCWSLFGFHNTAHPPLTTWTGESHRPWGACPTEPQQKLMFPRGAKRVPGQLWELQPPPHSSQELWESQMVLFVQAQPKHLWVAAHLPCFSLSWGSGS